MALAQQEYQHPEYLVETDWLQQHLDAKDLRVLDCTVHVAQNSDPETTKAIPFVYRSGRDDFEQSHIPNAGFIDIPDELSDKSAALPLMAPDEMQIAETMSKCGIGDDTRVVLYSTSDPNWAARVWWLLRASGFNNAAILNGGWKKWTLEKRPVSDATCTYSRGQFTVRHQSDFLVSKYQVLAALDNDNIRVINALPNAIHTGKSDIAFGRQGCIAGSVNVPFMSLHDSDSGTYLSANQLHETFDKVRVPDADRIITYCGGGIASSNTAFSLALLGYDNVAVYDGSMLEWGNDASLPMETHGPAARI